MMMIRTPFSRAMLLCFFAFISLPEIWAQASQYGQVRVRVFRSPKDSLQLIAVQQNIDTVLKQKPLRQKSWTA